MPPPRVLQTVAGGVLGRVGGGAGATLHDAIALAMAAAYAFAGGARLARRPLVAGSAYGLLLYVAMNHVVVPLSAAGPAPRDPPGTASGVLTHELPVGVPIAWIVSRTPAPASLSARCRPAP